MTEKLGEKRERIIAQLDAVVETERSYCMSYTEGKKRKESENEE